MAKGKKMGGNADAIRGSMHLTYHPFMLEEDPSHINGREILRRAEEMSGRPCDEERARMLMDDPSLVPEEYRYNDLIIEDWRHLEYSDVVAVLYWKADRLIHDWRSLDDIYWVEGTLVVRLNESPLAT